MLTKCVFSFASCISPVHHDSVTARPVSPTYRANSSLSIATDDPLLNGNICKGYSPSFCFILTGSIEMISSINRQNRLSRNPNYRSHNSCIPENVIVVSIFYAIFVLWIAVG